MALSEMVDLVFFYFVLYLKINIVRFCADLTVLVRFLNIYQHSYSNITSWNACSHTSCSSMVCPDSCHIQNINYFEYIGVLNKAKGKYPIWIRLFQERGCSHLLISATC